MGRDEEALKFLIHLERKAEIYRKLNDEEAELECYTKMIEESGYAPALLNKATLLIDRGEIEEAIKLLDRVYGRENQDVLRPLANFFGFCIQKV